MIILFRRKNFIALFLTVALALFGGNWLARRFTNQRAGAVSVRETDWKPAPARLATRFAASVSPKSVRPEYPRPLLVRKDWLSLNGLWQFGFDDLDVGEKEGWQTGKELSERILVPFPFEAALSGIGRGTEVHERVWYRRSFEVPSGWQGRRVRVNFGAVDWEARVFLNGNELGIHQGGYTPFSYDITDALKDGANELVVRVFDPSEKNPLGWQPRGKQRGSDGIWYTRTTGIWQSVWLEPVGEGAITQLKLTPGLEPGGRGTLKFQITMSTKAAGATLTLAIPGAAQASVTVSPEGVADGVLTLEKAKPWTPETPYLYDLSLKVARGSTVLDEATSYTAFRSVGIAQGRLTLNGKPYFYRGVLDQGFWPEGIHTPPSDEALRFDVEQVKKLGWNMARKHIKVEDPRWYYWCDKLGVAVWQDMPASINLDSPESRTQFKREWEEVLKATQSYPSVVHWIPFNENWGNPQIFQDEIVVLTRSLEPSRPITDASGWTQRGMTDVIDAHNYSDNLVREGGKNLTKPKVVGEFGGVGLSMAGHVWNEGRIYIHAASVEQLVTMLRRRVSQMFEAENLSGYVYTQLTDVEQELNGLLTYDRLPKADTEVFARIMRGEDRTKVPTGPPLARWLVLGPIPSGTAIVGTDPAPASLEAMGKILDTAFITNEASLAPRAGQSVAVGGQQRTWRAVTQGTLDFHALFGQPNLSNAVAYAVTYIESPSEQKVELSMGSDDGAVVWLNGQRIHRMVAVRGVNADEDRVEGVTLRKGRNVLVAKIGQGNGGWGMIARLIR